MKHKLDLGGACRNTLDDRTKRQVRIHRDLSGIGGKVVAEFEELLRPVLTEQLDLLKTLLSLGAGALTLLATFGQSLLGGASSSTAHVLYGASLSLLVLTVILSVVARWRAVKISEFGLLMNAVADRLAASVVAAEADGGNPTKAASVEVGPSTREVTHALQWFDRFFRATLLVFLLGFLCLGILAWVLYAS